MQIAQMVGCNCQLMVPLMTRFIQQWQEYSDTHKAATLGFSLRASMMRLSFWEEFKEPWVAIRLKSGLLPPKVLQLQSPIASKVTVKSNVLIFNWYFSSVSGPHEAVPRPW